MPAFLERASAAGKFANAERAAQFFENAKTRERWAVMGEWELPEGASLSQSNGEAIISLLGSFSLQARI